MTQIHVGAVLLFKKGTKAELEASTIIPKEGEPVFETDTGKLKVGDGQLTYVNLPYVDNIEIVTEVNSESSNDTAAGAAAVYEYGQSIKDYADGKFRNHNSAISDALLRAETAEKNAIASAKEYTDKVKTDLLGEGIAETFDTLVEIQNWINGDGVDATELTSAIAEEARLREAGDQAVTNDIDTRYAAAVIEMQNEYRAIEPNLKAYVDEQLGVIANGLY